MSATAADADDVMFAQAMIAHHRQALDMADDALDPVARAGAPVLELARRIDAAQGPEIDETNAWLEARDRPVGAGDDHDHDTMDGMMSGDDLAALTELRGSAFDARWLELMVAHHEGAVTMAAAVQVDGEEAELRALAERIVAAQMAEIAEMRALLAG